MKGTAIRAAGRIGLCAQVETAPYMYATVEGPVTMDGAPTAEQALAIAGRYLPAEAAAGYVKEKLGESSLLVRMHPEKVAQHRLQQGVMV